MWIPIYVIVLLFQSRVGCVPGPSLLSSGTVKSCILYQVTLFVLPQWTKDRLRSSITKELHDEQTVCRPVYIFHNSPFFCHILSFVLVWLGSVFLTWISISSRLRFYACRKSQQSQTFHAESLTDQSEFIECPLSSNLVLSPFPFMNSYDVWSALISGGSQRGHCPGGYQNR